MTLHPVVKEIFKEGEEEEERKSISVHDELKIEEHSIRNTNDASTDGCLLLRDISTEKL